MALLEGLDFFALGAPVMLSLLRDEERLECLRLSNFSFSLKNVLVEAVEVFRPRFLFILLLVSEGLSE